VAQEDNKFLEEFCEKFDTTPTELFREFLQLKKQTYTPTIKEEMDKWIKRYLDSVDNDNVERLKAFSELRRQAFGYITAGGPVNNQTALEFVIELKKKGDDEIETALKNSDDPKRTAFYNKYIKKKIEVESDGAQR